MRRIFASIVASYHWLSAPQAPAPSAMHRMAVNPSTSGGITGAASIPHRPVKTTRLITRGLVSATKSRQSAGSAAGFVISMVGMAGPIRAWPREEKPAAGRAGDVHLALLCEAVMRHRPRRLAHRRVVAAAFAQASATGDAGPDHRRPVATADRVPVASTRARAHRHRARPAPRTDHHRQFPPLRRQSPLDGRTSTGRCTCGRQGRRWGPDPGRDHHRRTQGLSAAIPHESTSQTGIKNVAGAYSMANAGPGTAKADFFILLSDMPGLDAGGPAGTLTASPPSATSSRAWMW